MHTLTVQLNQFSICYICWTWAYTSTEYLHLFHGIIPRAKRIPSDVGKVILIQQSVGGNTRQQFYMECIFIYTTIFISYFKGNFYRTKKILYQWHKHPCCYYFLDYTRDFTLIHYLLKNTYHLLCMRYLL